MLKRLKGKKLTHININSPKIVQNTTAEDLSGFFVGSTLDRIDRVSKILQFGFGENSMVIHLMLHGNYWWGEPLAKRTHVVCEILWDENVSLLIKDWSSWVKVEVDIPKLSIFSPMLSKQYGADFFKGELDEESLAAILKRHPRIGIKKLLMDQRIVSGIGNAYADEILWDAKIHPGDSVGKITENGKTKLLFDSMSKVLSASLALVRTLSEGEALHEQPRDFMKVYKKSGHACPRCGYMLSCRKLNSRDTYLCEKCQHSKISK